MGILSGLGIGIIKSYPYPAMVVEDTWLPRGEIVMVDGPFGDTMVRVGEYCFYPSALIPIHDPVAAIAILTKFCEEEAVVSQWCRK